MSDQPMQWQLYLQWSSGRRETIVADRPVLPERYHHAYLQAAMPLPRLAAFPGEMPPALPS